MNDMYTAIGRKVAKQIAERMRENGDTTLKQLELWIELDEVLELLKMEGFVVKIEGSKYFRLASMGRENL